MQRFLVLYTDYSDPTRKYAEGLVCVDGAVYVRGFAPEEGKLFGDLYDLRWYLRDNEDLRWYLRDNEDIRIYRIQMIDEESRAEP